MNASGLLKIDKVIFTDGTTINKCIGIISGGFLIIGKDTEDNSPIWYSLNTIVRLEGVSKEAPARMKISLF